MSPAAQPVGTQVQPNKPHAPSLQGVSVGMAFTWLFLGYLNRKGIQLSMEESGAYTCLITGVTTWVRSGGIGDLVHRIRGWFA